MKIREFLADINVFNNKQSDTCSQNVAGFY